MLFLNLINVIFEFAVVDTRVNITIRLIVTKVVLNELSNENI